jgi:hypothetical protein
MDCVPPGRAIEVKLDARLLVHDRAILFPPAFQVEQINARQRLSR